jgi:undecaprenyl-diphosphatase
MDFLQAIVLGIIEGITEFLPISSTGHLILGAHLMGLEESNFLKSFEIAIQLGAILSIVYLYWHKVTTNSNLFKKLVVAFVPTAVIGLIAYPFIKEHLLGSQEVVLWALFLGGVAIFVFEKWFSEKHTPTANLESMSYKQALGIGFAQAVAVIPGVSRAAATIIGGMVAGIDRRSIVEFSFLLAVPTMAAATGLDLVKSGGSFSSQEFMVMGVGFIVSFLTALLAVKWLLKYIQNNNFIAFGIYRIGLAVLFWILLV